MKSLLSKVGKRIISIALIAVLTIALIPSEVFAGTDYKNIDYPSLTKPNAVITATSADGKSLVGLNSTANAIINGSTLSTYATATVGSEVPVVQVELGDTLRFSPFNSQLFNNGESITEMDLQIFNTSGGSEKIYISAPDTKAFTFNTVGTWNVYLNVRSDVSGGTWSTNSPTYQTKTYGWGCWSENGQRRVYNSSDGNAWYFTQLAVKCVAKTKTVSSITLRPYSQTIVGYNNLGREMTVTANYSDGTTRDVTSECRFESSNSSRAYVSGNFARSGSQTGTATITAYYSVDGTTKTDTATIDVVEQDKTLVNLTLTPYSQTIIGYNTIGKEMTVLATYSNNEVANVTSSCTFNSANSSVAYISGNYARSGSSKGATTVTAYYYYNGIQKTANATVTVEEPTAEKTLSEIDLTPGTQTITDFSTIGKKLTVIAIYKNGASEDVTNRCTFSSSNSSIATTSGTYAKSGTTEGTAIITASYTYSGVTKTDTATVKVSVDEDIPDDDDPEGTVELEKIVATPASKTIYGLNKTSSTVKVIAYYSDDTDEDVTDDCDFESEDEDIAYVTSSNKLHSGDDDGTVEITVTYKEDGNKETDTIKVKVVDDDDEDIDDEDDAEANFDDDFNDNIKGLAVELENKDDNLKYLEGTDITYYVDYYNGSSEDMEDVEIKLTFPSKMDIRDADKGTKKDGYITWNLGTIDSYESGRYEVTLSYNDVNGTTEIQPTAYIYSDGSKKDESFVKNLVFEVGASGYHNAYVYGYPDGTFRPTNNITRQEFAAILSRLFNLGEFNVSSYSYNSNTNYYTYTGTAAGYYSMSGYKDVTPDTCWGYNEIMQATSLGLLTGYSDNTFRPEAPVTRAEFLAILARKVGVANEETLTIHFPQIKMYWASNEIEQLGRLKDILDTDIVVRNITQPATRAEVVTILNRANYRGPLNSAKMYFYDVSAYNWAFGSIQEAAISHSYRMESNGSETEGF